MFFSPGGGRTVKERGKKGISPSFFPLARFYSSRSSSSVFPGKIFASITSLRRRREPFFSVPPQCDFFAGRHRKRRRSTLYRPMFEESDCSERGRAKEVVGRRRVEFPLPVIFIVDPAGGRRKYATEAWLANYFFPTPLGKRVGRSVCHSTLLSMLRGASKLLTPFEPFFLKSFFAHNSKSHIRFFKTSKGQGEGMEKNELLTPWPTCRKKERSGKGMEMKKSQKVKPRILPNALPILFESTFRRKRKGYFPSIFSYDSDMCSYRWQQNATRRGSVACSIERTSFSLPSFSSSDLDKLGLSPLLPPSCSSPPSGVASVKYCVYSAPSSFRNGGRSRYGYFQGSLLLKEWKEEEDWWRDFSGCS